LSESKRLLKLKNAELAQLQARLQGAKPAAPAAAPSTESAKPPPASPPAIAAPSATTTPAPATAAEQGKAPPAESAATAPAQETPAPLPAAQAPATKPERVRRPPHVAPAAESTGSSFSDVLKDYWWAIALAIVALLALFGLRAWRSRRQSEFDDSLGRLAVAGANSIDRSFGGDGGSVRSAPAGEAAFLVEESGSHQRPRTPGAGTAATAARHVASADETMSSETAINLDQGDPLAEADFHMAYGLYDQAADLIRIAISREPNRRDLKLKLLEVFFVWGNKEQFLLSARELAETRDQAAPGEWEKIVIMGKQLAPEDPLFAGGGAVSGATAGGVDLDLEGGESRVDFDLLGEPIPGQVAGSDVDLDIGSALGDTMASADPHTGATDRNANLDHVFSSSSTGTTGTTRQMTQKFGREPEPVMPEYGAETEAPTVEQPALPAGENPTIRQKVAMALKQTQSTDATAELAIDDLGLDLGALDTVDQPGLGSSPDAPTLVAGLDERSRKVMEDAQRRASGENQAAATGAWHVDRDQLSAARGQISGLSATGTYDVSATSRLAALSGNEVDFDLGDADADGSHSAHATNGSGLDLDVGSATVPDTAFTSTQKLESEDLALPDLEPVTMSEVGTKLDLARAYMDMGDPEGARNILDEVLTEGSVAQKQEAQRLIESLPG